MSWRLALHSLRAAGLADDASMDVRFAHHLFPAYWGSMPVALTLEAAFSGNCPELGAPRLLRSAIAHADELQDVSPLAPRLSCNVPSPPSWLTLYMVAPCRHSSPGGRPPFALLLLFLTSTRRGFAAFFVSILPPGPSRCFAPGPMGGPRALGWVRLPATRALPAMASPWIASRTSSLAPLLRQSSLA